MTTEGIQDEYEIVSGHRAIISPLDRDTAGRARTNANCKRVRR